MSDGQVSVYVLVWLLPAAVGLALLARYLYRIGRELWGTDASALAYGALPLWTLAVPALAVGGGVHRLQLYVAAKRAERAEK